MLARESDQPFDDKEWLFEIKFDGYRAISEIRNGNVNLYSRNGLSFNAAYPIVVNELKKIKHDVILDGEIVVLNEEGKPDFQKLQYYGSNSQFPICYYVFDVLSVNGHDTCGLELIERKSLVEKILKKNSIIRYSDHVLEDGKDFFKAAQQQDLEGIIAKKISSEYHPGTRTGEWLKIKHHKSEDVIIAGFTQPTGSRKYFGALVLAIPSENGLKYAGHTGSGFDEKLLKEIYDKLKPLSRKDSPFNEVVKTNTPVTWVEPRYICEIKFSEWTKDGKMRHPIFLRMRDDKTIKDLTMVKSIAASSKKATVKKNNTKVDQDKDKVSELVIGKIKVKITNRSKIYFPGEGITKKMVIDYYQSVADYILPHLKNRPESLKRNPNGITDKGFFHKDAGEEAPAWVKSIKIHSDSGNKDIDYILCNDKATLAYLNNLGCIEINPWNSTTKALDNPDYMIIDIDPSEKNTFDQVVETANVFKKVFDQAGASCFCKTSGATGLHIFVPMGAKYSYDQVRDFAQFTCMLANKQLPGFTTLERNLKKRGNKKIYLDYLQNRRGQTISSVYSVRPYPGATVSTPLTWNEVKKGLHPSAFDINTVPKRLIKMQEDIFKGVLGPGINLKKCLDNLSGSL